MLLNKKGRKMERWKIMKVKGGRRNGKGIKGKSQRKNEKQQRQQKKKPMESTLSKVYLFPYLSFS
jgi:hypothetical protein